LDEVKTAIAEGRPYSVVFDKLNAHHPMFVIVKANHKVSLYRIYCEDIHGIYLYGMWHATTAISTNICYEYNYVRCYENGKVSRGSSTTEIY